MSMSTFLQFEPTKIAQWRRLVIEGEQKSGFQLPELIENYMVMMLDAYTTETSLCSVIIAFDFLNNIRIDSIYHSQQLRAVGDQCLIISGLFPERFKRKNVSNDYFSNLGKNAYYVLSHTPLSFKLDRSLFYQLFENFGELIAVLKAMRIQPKYIFN